MTAPKREDVERLGAEIASHTDGAKPSDYYAHAEALLRVLNRGEVIAARIIADDEGEQMVDVLSTFDFIRVRTDHSVVNQVEARRISILPDMAVTVLLPRRSDDAPVIGGKKVGALTVSVERGMTASDFDFDYYNNLDGANTVPVKFWGDDVRVFTADIFLETVTSSI